MRHDPLRARLHDQPAAGVPLRPGEPDATLDLKPLLDQVYDAAGYAYYIYQGDPEPRLATEVAAWARQFLPAAT